MLPQHGVHGMDEVHGVHVVHGVHGVHGEKRFTIILVLKVNLRSHISTLT